MLTILSFIAMIIIVVTVHEYGHYLAARWYRVRILRFSVGFGTPILRRRDSRGTEWVLAPIPLGGYVRLLDAETARLHNLPQTDTVESRHPFARIVIYAAGPIANFILSILLTLLILSGGEQGLRPLIESATGHAARAGIVEGDEISAINGTQTRTWRQAQIAISDIILAQSDDLQIETITGGQHSIPADQLSIETLTQPGGALSAIGITPDSRYVKLQLTAVVPESPADHAGITVGDTILMLGDTVTDRWLDAVAIIEANPGVPLPIVIWRSGAALTLTVTPQTVADNRGNPTKGYLGVAPVIDQDTLRDMIVTIHYPPLSLIGAAFKETGADIGRALHFLRLLFTGGGSREHVSGPVGIATQSGAAAELGINAWLRFVSLISISLGIINLLPLPLLDGGQIILNVIQWISAREFSDNLLRIWNISGVTILIMIMAFVIINDISQLI